jgi:inner membrane protein
MAGNQSTARSWRWYLFAAVAAVAPDFDLLPGLLVGDANRFHQGVSHSLGAAVVFGAVSILAARWLGAKPFRVAVISTVLYSSHLLLDFFVDDKRPPFGIPLLWPASDGYWMSPLPVFGGIKHGIPGDSVFIFLTNVFSWYNIRVMAIETLVFVPMLVCSWYLTGHRWKSTCGDTTAYGISRK